MHFLALIRKAEMREFLFLRIEIESYEFPTYCLFPNSFVRFLEYCFGDFSLPTEPLGLTFKKFPASTATPWAFFKHLTAKPVTIIDTVFRSKHVLAQRNIWSSTHFDVVASCS